MTGNHLDLQNPKRREQRRIRPKKIWVPQMILLAIYVVLEISIVFLFQENLTIIWYYPIRFLLLFLPVSFLIASKRISRRFSRQRISMGLIICSGSYGVKILGDVLTRGFFPYVFYPNNNLITHLAIMSVVGIIILVVFFLNLTRWNKNPVILVALSCLYLLGTIITAYFLTFQTGGHFHVHEMEVLYRSCMVLSLLGTVLTSAMTCHFVTVLSLELARRMENRSMKSRSTTIILSILLGELGLDRLYLGYTGLGIVKLLTAGGFGIWWIVDIVMACTGSLRPADGSLYREESEPSRQRGRFIPPPKVTDALRDLHELYVQGIISPEEYARKRERLMEQL